MRYVGFCCVVMLPIRSFNPYRDGPVSIRGSVSQLPPTTYAAQAVTYIPSVVPSLLETLFLTLFAVIALNGNPRQHGRTTPPESGIIGTLAYATFSIILSMPATIITYRYAMVSLVFVRLSDNYRSELLLLRTSCRISGS